MHVVIRSLVLAMALALAGCATTHPQDPLEKFNRVMFSFNDRLDQAAVKPAAEAYRNTLPTFVQTGVGNFFGNLSDPWTAANNFMQGKMADGLSDTMRFLVNTSFGLVGVLDIATEAGLDKHSEDFGQTLGKWGVRSGPYVVLPIFGSSTLRDVIVLPLDTEADPWHHLRPARMRNVGTGLRLVDQRALLLDASNLIEEAALDRYEFVRDAYLQRRQNKVYDGDPPTSAYEYDIGPTTTSGEGGASIQEAASGNAHQEIKTEPDVHSVVKTEK